MFSLSTDSVESFNTNSTTHAPYNPLDKISLAKSVAEALLSKQPAPLGEIDGFNGAGIYAIYYRGSFPAYAPIAKANKDGAHHPIYLGKAIPSGGRKGDTLFSEVTGHHLWNRLREHAESVRAANNLNIDDFQCRYLVIDDIWIPLGESLLIAQFRPVWNLYLEGFGNHNPGAGRYGGQRPSWDCVHEGRPWAAKCQPRSQTPDELARGVEQFLKTNLPLDTHVFHNSVVVCSSERV
jgi:hypothetical protein